MVIKAKKYSVKARLEKCFLNPKAEFVRADYSICSKDTTLEITTSNGWKINSTDFHRLFPRAKILKEIL